MPNSGLHLQYFRTFDRQAKLAAKLAAENVASEQDFRVYDDKGNLLPVHEDLRNLRRAIEMSQNHGRLPPPPRRYTVRSGDTLSQIAQRKGIGSTPTVGAQRIADLNRLLDANRIRAGQEIKIPSR